MEKKSKFKKTLFFVMGGTVIVLALGYIIFSSFSEAIYYYTVAEAAEKGDSLIGEQFRLKGKVVKNSLECTKGTSDCTFRLVHSGEELVVHSVAPLPDAFQDDADVVALGKLKDKEIFEAIEVTAKCPSKYESK